MSYQKYIVVNQKTHLFFSEPEESVWGFSGSLHQTKWNTELTTQITICRVCVCFFFFLHHLTAGLKQLRQIFNLSVYQIYPNCPSLTLHPASYNYHPFSSSLAAHLPFCIRPFSDNPLFWHLLAKEGERQRARRIVVTLTFRHGPRVFFPSTSFLFFSIFGVLLIISLPFFNQFLALISIYFISSAPFLLDPLPQELLLHAPPTAPTQQLSRPVGLVLLCAGSFQETW